MYIYIYNVAGLDMSIVTLQNQATCPACPSSCGLAQSWNRVQATVFYTEVCFRKLRDLDMAWVTHQQLTKVPELTIAPPGKTSWAIAFRDVLEVQPLKLVGIATSTLLTVQPVAVAAGMAGNLNQSANLPGKRPATISRTSIGLTCFHFRLDQQLLW